MAVGPTSLSCCLCLAPARTAGGPLLLHPLRLGPPLASLCPLPFFFGPTAALNRSLSARLSLRLPWPLLASGRHNQYSPGCLPIPLSRLHDIHRHLRIPYGAWSGGSTLGSVPPSLPARPVGAHGFSSEGGATPQLVPLRKQLRSIKRLDPKLQLHVLREGLGRPRCQRAQRLLKRGEWHVCIPCAVCAFTLFACFSLAPGGFTAFQQGDFSWVALNVSGGPCVMRFVARGPAGGLCTVPFLLAAAEASLAVVEKCPDCGGVAASFVSRG